MECPMARSCVPHTTRLDTRRADRKAGNKMAISKAMMLMTTSNSTSVKARERRHRCARPDLVPYSKRCPLFLNVPHHVVTSKQSRDREGVVKAVSATTLSERAPTSSRFSWGCIMVSVLSVLTDVFPSRSSRNGFFGYRCPRCLRQGPWLLVFPFGTTCRMESAQIRL